MKSLGDIMHKELSESGLGEIFKIRAMTSDLELGKFLGKKVRIKRELLSQDYIRLNGTIVINAIFLVKETQIDYRGTPCLRGYESDTSFGSVLYPNELEIME